MTTDNTATSKIPAVERLINLTAYLLSTRGPKPLREIVSRVEGYVGDADFESLRRKFIRDRQTLLELDIPVRHVKTRDPDSGLDTDSYTIDPADFYLPVITVSDDEIAALSRLGRRLKGATSTPALKELDWALAKIMSASARTAAATQQPDHVLVRLDRDTPNSADPALIDFFLDAIASRRPVDIIHRSTARPQPTNRRIEPYGLFLRSGLWYVVGNCKLRGGVRMFRLDRIETDPAAKRPARDSKYEIPADFSISSHVARRAPWEFGDERPVNATVKFHPDMFWQVRNAWGDIQSATFDPDARTMTVRCVNAAGLACWTLGFGPQAEIISPQSLRTKMKETLTKMMNISENT